MPANQNSPIQTSPPVKIQGGSLGLKLIIVCALVMLMSIPAMFISYVNFERGQRADEVTREVSARYGGEQYISGPILVAPYTQTNARGQISESGHYIIFAESGHADFSGIETAIRRRSLFKVPTYKGQGSLVGSFAKIEDPENLMIDWSRAKIVVSLSDVRGLQKDVELILPGGGRRKFEPAEFDNSVNRLASIDAETVRTSALTSKTYQAYGWLRQDRAQTHLSVPVADINKLDQAFTVKVNMTLGGARRLGVVPFAQSTTVNISADWADPGFEGGFPPDDREITTTGFSANWSVPYLRRGIRGQGKAHNLTALTDPDKIMTVQFVATDNPYQTVNRALKYSVLFIGMVFLAYFLFEVIVGIRVHPAQYILIGLAQSIFYLLLLAFSERIGFTGAFLISACATIAATAGYAGAVFGHRKYMARAAAVFTLVYGLLYVLMRMQDFALMIGALASFIAIAATMYLTRNMNWYGVMQNVKKEA